MHILKKLPYEVLIGLRYTRTARRGPRRNRFISFISILSSVGIALGVTALIVVLSVLNGFQKDVRDRMLSVIPHIEISAGSGSLSSWQEIANIVIKQPNVLAVAPYAGGGVAALRDDQVKPLYLRGVDPVAEANVSDLMQGNNGKAIALLTPGEFGIVLGFELASSLGVKVGDKLTLLAPEGSVTPVGVVPRPKNFRVVGTFDSGHYEFDSSLAFVHLQDAAKFLRIDGASGLRVKIKNIHDAQQIAYQLAEVLPKDLYIRDWSKMNQIWFAAVQIEKRMMFVILALIVAVAAFNLVSMLVMTVTEKRGDIAILRTLGATPGAIQRIFMLQGILIGLLGVGLGVLVGVLLAFNVDSVMAGVEKLFQFQVLPKGIYLINKLPSDPRWADISLVSTVAFALTWIATIYPSWRAARIEPAEALRYE
jgi:lipoprotein-releasing system permease protein